MWLGAARLMGRGHGTRRGPRSLWGIARGPEGPGPAPRGGSAAGSGFAVQGLGVPRAQQDKLRDDLVEEALAVEHARKSPGAEHVGALPAKGLPRKLRHQVADRPAVPLA